MSTLEILLGAGLLSFASTLITLFVTRGKTSAEIQKLLSETELTRIEAQMDLQKQLDGLRASNEKLYNERDAEREAKNALRGEIEKLRREVELLREELQVERSRSIALLGELERQRGSGESKTVQLAELRGKLETQAEVLKRHNVEIDSVKRKTGKLEFPKE